MEKLEFQLILQSQEVTIVDKDGVSKEYVLKELTGAQRDTYLDDVGGRLRYHGGKAAGLRTHKGLQAGLVAMCLVDDTDALVPKATIQEFPSSTLQGLFKAAQILSSLQNDEDEDEDEVKNE